MTKKEILIIGGGFAGLSAGVKLSSRGHHVTVIEKKGKLGGRAYSFKDPATGSVLDNGQHVLMGCYRETIAFLEKIGTLDRVDFQKNLSVDFASPGGPSTRFQAMPLPNPFHLLGGFLSFRGLSLKEKFSVWRVKKALESVNSSLDKKSVTAWLTELGQTPQIQERFFDLFNLAALNDRPEVSSAGLFAAVLKESLFSGRRNASIGLSRVGLSDLYTEAARDFIESRGGQILTKAPVLKLHFHNREFQEAEMEGGRCISAETLLIAVPFTALKKILPESIIYEDPFFASLSQLKSSPIVSVNLWLDRRITDRPFVGFWGTKMHWLFNKGRVSQEGPPYLSLVISGAREELQIPGPDLVALAMKELASIYPEMASAKLLHSMVLKEPEATLAPAVGVSRLRLPQKTPYKNLFLAGDWTDTGLPATIESAVRSANKAVELIEATG